MYSFTTHEFAYGIAWDGAYLWIGDNVGNIYGYDLNGNLVGSFSSPNVDYSAISFNGENFILRNPWYAYDSFYEVDYSGTVVNMFYNLTEADSATSYEIVDIGYNQLAALDYNNNRIVEISLDDGAGTYTIMGEMDFDVGALSYPIGYNGNLWSQDWYGQLYEVEYHGADWGLEWLELSAYSGNIPANQSETIAVEFFGSDLIAGKYDAVMYIASNDVDNPVVELDATMRVMGPPRFSPPSELGFGELQFMDSTYRDVHVTNYDSVDLTLTASIMYNSPSFELMNTDLTVPPGENGEFWVMARSDLYEGWYSDTLIMNTSHTDLATVHINTWVNSVPRVEPIILDIADVPDDQGGWVIMEFTRSYYDDWWATGRTELYTIELYDGNNWVASNSSVAYQQNRYFSLVHTLEDSNSVSEGVTDFRVVAGMHEGTWFSEVGSGYSMDNLPPDIPTGLMAEQQAEFIRVSWQHNTDEEIQYYEVHKSSNMDFIDNQYSIFTLYLIHISEPTRRYARAYAV